MTKILKIQNFRRTKRSWFRRSGVLAYSFFGGSLILLALAGTNASGLLAKPADVIPTTATLVCHFADESILESSGLAVSFQNSEHYWTHNDSGDTARVFLFHASGKTAMTLNLEEYEARDWEDMVSYVDNGISKLLIADTGDNGRVRQDLSLYRVTEPKLEIDSSSETESIDQIQRTISAERYDFKFVDGALDCESIAVDLSSQRILLIEKGYFAGRVYTLPLVQDNLGGEMAVAQRIAQVAVPMATAADISQDGRALIVLNYSMAVLYVRSANADGIFESWEDRLGRPGIVLQIPAVRQAEAICFAPDGKSFFLSSEGKSAPFYSVTIPPQVFEGIK